MFVRQSRSLSGLFVSGLCCLGLAALTVVGTLALPQNAQAHAGHSGAMLHFVDKKVALKQMLPAGAKIIRRKEALHGHIHTYFLARDRDSGQTTGLAMVDEVAYHHGKMALAVGITPQGSITKAALLGIHSKYEADLNKSIGQGFLGDLEGKTADQLKAMAAQASPDDTAAIEVLNSLSEMVALLTEFSH